VVEISINGVTQRLTSCDIDMTLIELAQRLTFDFMRCSEVEMKPPMQAAAATAEVDVRASA
jgi:hypothetical protein